MHDCIIIDVYTCMIVDVCTCMTVDVYTCMCIYMHVYIHACVYTCTVDNLFVSTGLLVVWHQRRSGGQSQ